MYIALLFAILLVIAVLAFFEDEEIQSRGWLLLALATVLTEALGLYSAVSRYSGTTSLALDAATKPFIGSPILLANIPAARLP